MLNFISGRRTKIIYRIHFEPRGGKFVIQFKTGFFFWETVQCRGGEPLLEDLTFETYDAAEEYVIAKGINKAYDRCSTKGFSTGLQSGALVQANIPPGYKLVPEGV